MFKNPFSRESRVAVDLLNQKPYRECVDSSYGDESDDYSANETEEDDKDVFNYHNSLRPTDVTLKQTES
jgi:hypothetical protein